MSGIKTNQQNLLLNPVYPVYPGKILFQLRNFYINSDLA